MMTEEELNAFRKNIALNESSTVWLEKKMLSHIDEQASQIAKLKAALLNHVIDDLGDIRLSNRMADGGYDARTDDDLEKEAKDQLAKKYPEIFAEEKE